MISGHEFIARRGERNTRKLREQGRKREPGFDVVLVITRRRESLREKERTRRRAR